MDQEDRVFVVGADPLFLVAPELVHCAHTVALRSLKGEFTQLRVAELLQLTDFHTLDTLLVVDCQMNTTAWTGLREFVDRQPEQITRLEVDSLRWRTPAHIQSLFHSRFKHDASGEYRDSVGAFFEQLNTMSQRNEEMVLHHGHRMWRLWQEFVLVLRRLKNLEHLAVVQSDLNMLAKLDIDRSQETQLPSLDEAIEELPSSHFSTMAIFPVFHALDLLADQIHLSCLHSLVSIDLSSNNLCDPAIVHLVQTLSRSLSLQDLNLADNLISDCGYLLLLHSLPVSLAKLDLQQNQIRLAHPKLAPLLHSALRPGLTVLLQDNPGFPPAAHFLKEDEEQDLRSISSQTSVAISSCFGDNVVGDSGQSPGCPNVDPILLSLLEIGDADEEDDSSYATSKSSSAQDSLDAYISESSSLV